MKNIRVYAASLLAAIGLISFSAGIIAGIIGDTSSLLLAGIMAVVCLAVSCVAFGGAEIGNN